MVSMSAMIVMLVFMLVLVMSLVVLFFHILDTHKSIKRPTLEMGRR